MFGRARPEKTKPIKSTLDKIGELSVLGSVKIHKFIPRKLFLSSVETFKLPLEAQNSTKSKQEETTKSAKARILQHRFLCTTGLSPMDEPRSVTTRKTRRENAFLVFLDLKDRLTKESWRYNVLCLARCKRICMLLMLITN